jgi:nicotinamide mononucleotide transporter
MLESVMALSNWEWIAACLGIAYVILAAKESIWCWPAAFLSTLIYSVLFWEGQLPMQALLNVYYLGMAVYGFLLWRRPQSHPASIHISTRPGHFHFGFILTGILLTWATGYYLQQVVHSQLPYLDAAVTVFSVLNTVLMARKILETWLYWLVIDAAAIVLYWQSGYYVTIAMFAVYLLLAILGYRQWRQALYQRNAAASD